MLRTSPIDVGPSILAINVGSSSLKAALFVAGTCPHRIGSIKVERIGSAKAELTSFFDGRSPQLQSLDGSSHEAALSTVLEYFEAECELASLIGVGHRIVHGGPKYAASQVIDQPMLAELRALAPYDPGHLPAEIRIVEGLMQRLPNIKHVACFDTAFHRDLPTAAKRLPIPRRYDALGVRRYGFHGLSYTYLMRELHRVDANAAQGRVVLAHLGNGASLAAVDNGQCIDTSMAFTASAGIPMGTRSGDLDPGLFDFLIRAGKLTVEEFNRMIHSESGLKGISETTSDMQELLELEVKNVRAAEAVEIFCYQARKWIGAYAAALGGIDTLIFSGGIGERAAEVRARICDGLEFLGIELDRNLNCSSEAVISSGRQAVRVRVIASDEEEVIAHDVNRLCSTSDQPRWQAGT